MESSYWGKFTATRFSRRRALTATGVTAAAAVFLAACGGDDDKSSSSSGSGGGAKDTSGLLLQPADQTSSRKRGGTLNLAVNGVIAAGLDQNIGGSGGGNSLVNSAYNQLMRAKIGTYNEVPDGTWEPEFAKSFEQSGDALSVTFRLRGLKYDSRPPTNGRVSTSADVKYSWDRWEANSPRTPELSNSRNPDAPVVAVETPDEQTVVFKMKYPFAPFFAYMGSVFFPFMYPKEADGAYDVKTIARGAGQWTFADQRTGTNVELSRNPNYDHNGPNGEPYFDKLRFYDLADLTQISAQVVAGALDYNIQLSQEDVLALKKANPKLTMYQRPFFAKGSGGVFFGRRQGSPWNDDRVRKALAMNMDADLWGDNASNRKKFEAEGLPVNTRWFARAGPGYSWYLDPKKDELGAVSKNLKYNPDEAHKLLQATGMKLPIESVYNAQPFFPQNEPNWQSMLGVYQSSGDFKFSINPYPDFNSFLEKVRNTGGNFDGIGIAFYNDHHDYDFTLGLAYNPASTDYWLGKEREDPKLTDFFMRQRRELDSKKRTTIFQDFLKYDIEKLYYMPYHWPVDWEPYYIGQPWVGGWGWWQPYIEQNPYGAGQIVSQFWFDESKKT